MKSEPVDALMGLDPASRFAPKRSEILRVLVEARELLCSGPFVRGTLGVDSNGIPAERTRRKLVAWSLVGALKHVDESGGLCSWYAQRLLSRLVSSASLSEWVNHPTRKKADVLSLLKKAIGRFEGSRRPSGWRVTVYPIAAQSPGDKP